MEDEGLNAGGIYCPEIRSSGTREGFRIIDIMTDESRVLAHINEDDGPKVSKYRVNVPNVDYISKSAISRALEEADLLVIDEIAPMETHSDEFKQQVERSLNSGKPLLAVIHKRSKRGFIGKVKGREDTKLFELNKETREDLPKKLAELILESLS